MPTMTAVLFVFLGTLVTSQALAREFAEKRVVEAGGTAGLSITSTETESSKGDITAFNVSPEVGYFVIPGLEIIISPAFRYQRESAGGDPTKTTTFGIQGGAGYFLKAGSVYLGPRALIGYATSNSRHGSSEVTASGIVISAQGVLKIPVGFGGLINLGAGYSYADMSVDAGSLFSVDETVSGFGLDVGFTVYF